jgi:hypothetical protein
MKGSVVRRAVFVLVVPTLLAGSFFAGRLLAGQKTVQARAEAGPVSQSGIESIYTYIDGVAAYDDRIHVHTTTSPGDGIYFFAYPTGGSSGYTANRLLAIGQTAGVLNEDVQLFYDPNPESNPPGCDTSDCRLLTGIAMLYLP